MREHHPLTTAQRYILLGMAICVILVVGLLGWSVWQTMSGNTFTSPVASPTVIRATATLTVTVTATATPTPTGTPTPIPTFTIAEAGKIAEQVAEARGTMPRWVTPLTLVTEHELTVVFYERFEAHPPLVMQLQVPLQALRMWFWEDIEIDPRTQAQLTAALYFPDTEELYLQRTWEGEPDALIAQLAYGYARAIPDQHGGLPALLAEASSLDRRLALEAVADGDALVALYLYFGIEPGSERAWDLAQDIIQASSPHWDPDDPLLNDLSRLTLTMGDAFSSYLYTQGGTEALDEGILRPPRSTEQMLHPERYLFDEAPIALSPLDAALDEEWALDYEDTLGEAMLKLVVLEWSNGELTAEAIENWGGDLLQVWHAPDERDVVALQTAWDTNKAAGLFYGKMSDILPHALLNNRVNQEPAPAGLPSGRWWDGDDGAIFLRRDRDRVTIVWGSDVPAVETVSNSLENAEGGIQ